MSAQIAAPAPAHPTATDHTRRPARTVQTGNQAR